VLNSYGPKIKRDLRALFNARPDLIDRIRTVMSGFHLDMSAPKGGSPPFNYLLQLTITPLTDEESRSLIVTPVKGFYTYDLEVVQRIIDASAGRPLTLQTYCWWLIEHILGAKRRTVTLADLNAIEGRVLEDVRRIMDSGSSQAAVAPSLPEAQQRIVQLERELRTGAAINNG
jgi:hypothetical protein